MIIEDLLKESLNGKITLSSVQKVASIECCSLDEVFNNVALKIAINFQDRVLNFDDADFAINELWSVMVDYTFLEEFSGGLPHPAYSIYDAFDQGEYDHKDGKDPIEYHTKRLLKEALSDA
jgi:hypothetical protein